MQDDAYQPDLYTQWLGLPSGPRPPDYYTLLGLPPGCDDVARIEAAGHRQGDQLDRFRTSPSRERRDACARLMNEVARAVTVLRDPVRREAYNRSIGLDATGAVMPDASPGPESPDDDIPMAKPGAKVFITTQVTPRAPDGHAPPARAEHDGADEERGAAESTPGLPESNADASPLAPALLAESQAQAAVVDATGRTSPRRSRPVWRRWAMGLALLLTLALGGVGAGAWMAGFNPLSLVTPVIGDAGSEDELGPSPVDHTNLPPMPRPVQVHDRFETEAALEAYRALPDRTRLAVRDGALVVGVQSQGEIEIRRLIERQPVLVREAELRLRLAPDASLGLTLGPGAGLRLHRVGSRVTGHALPRDSRQPPVTWSADEPLRISLAPSPDGGTMVWTINGQTLRTFPESLMAPRLDPLRMNLRGPMGDCLWIDEISLVGQPMPRRMHLR